MRTGRYRHFKGTVYVVLGIGTHTETGEQMVIYRLEDGRGDWLLRPLEMFGETVEFEGKAVWRFTPIDD